MLICLKYGLVFSHVQRRSCKITHKHTHIHTLVIQINYVNTHAHTFMLQINNIISKKQENVH